MLLFLATASVGLSAQPHLRRAATVLRATTAPLASAPPEGAVRAPPEVSTATAVPAEEGAAAARIRAYFAAWNFVQKAAGGVSGWMIGVMLTATGFVANAAQSDAALLGIRLLASPWPVLLHALAFVLVWRFALDESAHRDARERAQRRQH